MLRQWRLETRWSHPPAVQNWRRTAAGSLTVTIGAVATLFVLMKATGKVDWSEVFRKAGRQSWPLPRPAAGTSAAPPEPPASEDREEKTEQETTPAVFGLAAKRKVKSQQ